MGIETVERSLDGGGPVVIHEEDPPPPCGHGVCVETVFGPEDTTGEVTLSLRRTLRHDGGPAEVDATRGSVRVALTSGVCTYADAEAEQLLVEHPWLRTEFVSRLDWLRERAMRHAAQRDRSTLFARLDRANPGDMVPHDEMFPADWDLLVRHGGEIYWAIDLYCTNAACDCKEVLVRLHSIQEPVARCVGELRIGLTSKPSPPKASSAPAMKLFEPLWSAHRAVLLARYDEVRRILRAHEQISTVHEAAGPQKPARNSPCPCGSGKKYKRCCVDRDRQAASPALATARAHR